MKILRVKMSSSTYQVNIGSINVLHQAVHENHEIAVKTLLDYGLDVDSRSWKGFTPLMIAVILGNEKMARYLLSSGADP